MWTQTWRVEVGQTVQIAHIIVIVGNCKCGMQMNKELVDKVTIYNSASSRTIS